MTKPNDGGPAFPSPETEFSHAHYGMTLRDWFAGQVLAGIIPAPGDTTFSAQEVANLAYTTANAMIAARGANQCPAKPY